MLKDIKFDWVFLISGVKKWVKCQFEKKKKMFGKLRKVKKNFLHIRSTMCVGFFFNGNPYCVHFTQKKFKSGTIKKTLFLLRSVGLQYPFCKGITHLVRTQNFRKVLISKLFMRI